MGMNILRELMKRYKFLHYLGLHNKYCSRRIFTTKKDYICLMTGKTFTNHFKKNKNN